MVRRHRLRRPAHLLPITLLIGGQLALIGAAPSAAAGAPLQSGALGAAARLEPKGGSAVDSGPLASLPVATSSEERKASLPSVSVSGALATGPVTVAAAGGSASAGAEAVNVLAGLLAADHVVSTCEASAAGTTRSSIVSGGRLAVSSKETIALPDSPAPNATIKAHSDALDSDLTVVLNHQTAISGIVDVTALRVVVDGPGAAGEIVVARSSCEAPASESAAPDPTETSVSTDAVTGATAVGVAEAAPSADPVASQVGTRNAAAADVTSFTASSYNYATSVSLFGGPAMKRGFGQQECTASNVPSGCVPAASAGASSSPSASCLAAGGPATNFDSDGAKAQYGPAVIFGGIWPDSILVAPPSGPLRSSVDCKTGEGGFAKSSTDQTLMPAGSAYPGGAGPGPFVADEVHTSCTASETGTSATTTIVNGKVETKYDVNTQDPIQSVPVATNPPRNTTVTGTIDHVGDSFRVVLNEQSTNSDGVLTVTAMHMFLLGPTAVGEMFIGQSVCGVRAQAATTTSTTTAGGTSSTSTPGTAGTTNTGATGGTSGGSGSSGGTSGSGTGTGSSTSTTGGGAGVAGTSTARTSSGTAAGNPLALTGATQQLALAMFLALAGLLASRWARTRRKPEPARTE